MESKSNPSVNIQTSTNFEITDAKATIGSIITYTNSNKGFNSICNH